MSNREHTERGTELQEQIDQVVRYTKEKNIHTPGNFSKLSSDLSEYTKWAQSNVQTTDAAFAAQHQGAPASR
jgi:acetyl-CoA carboxylase alpha subunit